MFKKIGIVAALALGWMAVLLSPTVCSATTPRTGGPDGSGASELFDLGESTADGSSRISQALDRAHFEDKFLFIYFHQKEDFRRFLPVLREGKSRFGGRASFVEADVRDATESMHVAKYGIRGTPFLLVVAPNGAVTAGFTEAVSVEDLEKALVSEAVAQLTLAVQNRSVVFLIVGNNERIYFDKAVATADSCVALLEGIGQSIILDPYDEETRRILQNSRIDIDPDMSELLVVSPSGGIVGRFPGNATQRDLLDSFQRILAQSKGCGARTVTGGSPCEPGRGVSGARGCGAQEGTLP